MASVLGAVMAASLLLFVLANTAATGPAESPRAGAAEAASNGGGTVPAETASAGSKDGSLLYEPVVPPEHPPTPVLSLGEGASPASGARQPGVQVYRHWVVDGKTDAREPEPPISWPDPLVAKSTDQAVLDIGTRVVPGTVDVLVYEKVGPDGVPNENPATVLKCESGRLVPSRLGGDESGVCPVPRGQGTEGLGSRLVLPVNSLKGGRYFLVVSASWPVKIDQEAEESAQTPTYDAAWIFSLEVDG